LDNLSDLSQVMVLGATNRIDLLDPALTRAGRLEFLLTFPLPEENDRQEIFQIHTAERPLAPDVDLLDLARRTEGMSGSQIAQVCRAAALAAITEIVKGPEEARSRKLSLRASHFHRAIEEGRKKEAPTC
jgi:transitional endoplasmic reticulum ATPase